MRLVSRTTRTGIVASIDQVMRDALIHTEHPVDDRQHDQPILYTGETVVQHDTTEPLTVYGEGVYIDTEGHTHLAGDLELHHEGGLEEEYEGYIEPRPPLMKSEATRQLAALKYADWIIHSDHALHNTEVTEAARDRIHRRAREYAEAAGVTDLLENVLQALGWSPRED